MWGRAAVEAETLSSWVESVKTKQPIDLPFFKLADLFE